MGDPTINLAIPVEPSGLVTEPLWFNRHYGIVAAVASVALAVLLTKSWGNTRTLFKLGSITVTPSRLAKFTVIIVALPGTKALLLTFATYARALNDPKNISEATKATASRTRRDLIKIIAREALASLKASYLFWCGSFCSEIRGPTSNETPLLLVHGYLHNRTAWIDLLKRLYDAGFRNVYLIDLGSPFLPIETSAQRVATKVQAIMDETGRKDISIVAHSRGGLVSAYYAECLASETGAQVSKIITLGTPFRGAPSANLVSIKAAKQMRPGSVFLERLAEERKKTTVEYFHVASEGDAYVYPTTAAIPGGTDDKHKAVFSSLGHLSLLYSSDVADQVIDWLKPEPVSCP